MQQVSGLRYGENPHQPAAFYSDLSLAEHSKGGIASAQLHHGKEVCPLLALQQLHLQQLCVAFLCCTISLTTVTVLLGASVVLLLVDVNFIALIGLAAC